jgi:hypothetical protein
LSREWWETGGKSRRWAAVGRTEPWCLCVCVQEIQEPVWLAGIVKVVKEVLLSLSLCGFKRER